MSERASCPWCGRSNPLATYARDGNRYNDSSANLVVLCSRCEWRLRLNYPKAKEAAGA